MSLTSCLLCNKKVRKRMNAGRYFDVKIVFEAHSGFLDSSTGFVMFYGRIFPSINDAVQHTKDLDYWKDISNKYV